MYIFTSQQASGVSIIVILRDRIDNNIIKYSSIDIEKNMDVYKYRLDKFYKYFSAKGYTYIM